MRALRLLVLVAVVSAPALLPATADARKFVTGFSDAMYQSTDPGERDTWFDRTLKARAGVVRLFITWRHVTSGQPADSRDPADPAYDFSRIDAAVRDATARGLDVLTTVYFAPNWAESSGRDPDAPPGTWKPKPAAVGDFAFALAKRYSGSFPDPTFPVQNLPRVRYFQDWNEPNIDTFLTPQYRGTRPVATRHYKRMLRSSYRAIKSVHRSNNVVSAGLAPYGGEPGGSRTRPIEFWRQVFCLKKGHKMKAKRKCSKKARFDIFGAHAINTSGPPKQAALHPDDASTGDLKDMRRVLRKAEKRRTIKPRGRHPMWITELWWESNPPDDVQGVRLRKQASYISETMHLAWRAGFETAIALQIRDAKVTQQNVRGRNASGIYFHNGTAKPSERAFRFPFVAERRNKRKIRIWGKAPAKGKVLIERRKRKGWRKLTRVKARRNQVFSDRVRLRGNWRLRADFRGEKSRVERVR